MPNWYLSFENQLINHDNNNYSIFYSYWVKFQYHLLQSLGIKNSKVEDPIILRKIVPEIYFRQIEKIMLYLTKHIVQWLILISVKYWFIVLAKVKNGFQKFT